MCGLRAGEGVEAVDAGVGVRYLGDCVGDSGVMLVIRPWVCWFWGGVLLRWLLALVYQVGKRYEDANLCIGLFRAFRRDICVGHGVVLWIAGRLSN